MACKRREQRKRAKMRNALTVLTMKEFMQARDCLVQNSSFGYCDKPSVCPSPIPQKDTNMNYAHLAAVAVTNAAETDVSKAKQHLLSRLHDIQFAHWEKLREHFGLKDDMRPQSPEELVKRIQDGKFVIPDHEQEDFDFYSPGDLVHFIKWRDPSKKKNKEGFEVAQKALRDAEKKVEDKIAVYDPEKGLKALEEFESKTFH